MDGSFITGRTQVRGIVAKIYAERREIKIKNKKKIKMLLDFSMLYLLS